MKKWVFLSLIIMPYLVACGDRNKETANSNTEIQTPPQAFNMLPIQANTDTPKILQMLWDKSVGATSYTLCEKDTSLENNCKALTTQAATEDAQQSLFYSFPLLLTEQNTSNKTYFIKATNPAGLALSSEKTIGSDTRAKTAGYLKASNIEAFGSYGFRMAVSANGEILVISAAYENDVDNALPNSGVVYVYKKQADGHWEEISQLRASNQNAEQHFGSSLAINDAGTVIVVGAEGTGAIFNKPGAAYVFEYLDNNWIESTILQANNPDHDDNFGLTADISADGKLIVIGAPNEASSNKDPSDNSNPNVGAVYVYNKEENGAWSAPIYLKPETGKANQFFAYYLDLSSNGRFLAVSATSDNSNTIDDPNNTDAIKSGAVWIFEKTDAGWQTPQFIKASNIGPHDLFGISVSFSGDGSILAIGSYREDSNSSEDFNDLGQDVGAVYVFDYNESNSIWEQSAYLKPNNISNNAYFSKASLSENGTTLAIGGSGLGTGGEVEIFKKEADNWVFQSRIQAVNSESGNGFARFIKISADGNMLYVTDAWEDNGNSTPGLDEGAEDSGAVYIY